MTDLEQQVAAALHNGLCRIEDHYRPHRVGGEDGGTVYWTPCHPDEAKAFIAALAADAPQPGQRWAAIDDGTDPEGRALAEKYVVSIEPQPGGSPDREGLREAAWLIEQGQPEGYTPPIYYALDQPRTAHYPRWTADPYKARMFERRELAIAFMESMRDGDRPMPGRPVEHGFISPRPADASVSETREAPAGTVASQAGDSEEAAR